MSSIFKEFSKVAKRKKRKTRRCLDEIRNRSLRIMRGDLSAHRENSVRDERKASSLITTNRLTLNMFPKSIRSETITRPLLEEIKQQSSLVCQGLPKNTNRIALKNKEVYCSEHSNSAASNNSMPLFDLHETPQEHHKSFLNYSLSPTTQVGIAESPGSTTSVSSQTSYGDQANEFYEELMNEVSAHLEKLSAAVIKEDFMRDTKMNLRKLLHQCCLEKSLQSHSQAALESPEELIVENPLSYLKLRRVHELVKYDESGLSEPSSLAPSPAGYGSSPQVQLDSLGVCTHNIALYNTPQYNYYPHKLN